MERGNGIWQKVGYSGRTIGFSHFWLIILGEHKLLKIIDFIEDHAEQALSIAKDNYEKERKSIPILPEFVEFPDFSTFCNNGLGVSAFDENKMLGYLCCYDPFEKVFGTTNIIGLWPPIHGN